MSITVGFDEPLLHTMIELIDQMYDNDSLIEELLSYYVVLMSKLSQQRALIKKDLPRFLLNELADIKYAYLRGEY